jgi:hypothetical protein
MTDWSEQYLVAQQAVKDAFRMIHDGDPKANLVLQRAINALCELRDMLDIKKL